MDKKSEEASERIAASVRDAGHQTEQNKSKSTASRPASRNTTRRTVRKATGGTSHSTTRRKSHRLFRRLRMIIAMVVVFTTTYTLILPALTLEKDKAANIPGLESQATGQEAETDPATATTLTAATDPVTATTHILACPYEAHQHTDACYEERPILDEDGRETGETEKVLICQKADYVVHEHDANCYRNGELVCRLPEIREHKHDEKCYEKQKVLTCKLQETDGHHHTESCYTTEDKLTCGMAEHTHTDACYSEATTGTEKQLICGHEEGEVLKPAVYSDPVYDDETGELLEEAELISEPVIHHHDSSCYKTIEKTERRLTCGKTEHTHSDKCYTRTKKLTCGLEEGEAHHHSDACYTEKKVLTCDKPELHTHTIDCYEKGPKDESPLEMGWVKYEEDEDGNKTLVGDPKHLICGKIELLAHQHGEACITEVPESTGDKAEGAEAADRAETTNPDAETVQAAQDETSEVAAAQDETSEGFTSEDETSMGNASEDETSQGNASEDETSGDQTADDVKAGGTDAENINNETNDTQFSRDVTVEGAPYSIRVTFTDECGIPEDAVITASALAEGSELYEAYRDRAVEAVEENEALSGKIAAAVPGLFDLTITDGQGMILQPKAPVTVDVIMDGEINTGENAAYAVHFPGSGAAGAAVQTPEPAGTDGSAQSQSPAQAGAAQRIKEKLRSTGIFTEKAGARNAETELIEAQTQDDNTVEFEAEGFSYYAIVYTVDFHYDVDGETYDYSIPGGSSVSLKNLLPILGVIKDDPDTLANEIDKFAEEIKDVTFTDESLVRVAHPEEDITLKDLKDQLGVTSIISGAFALNEAESTETGNPEGIPEETDVQENEENAYVIDRNAGDTDGLSFEAPTTEEQEAYEEAITTTEHGGIAGMLENAGVIATRAQESESQQPDPQETESRQSDSQETGKEKAEDSEADSDDENEDSTELPIAFLNDDDVITAGTWVLISLKPFDTDETLTIKMKNGDVFTVDVTDEWGNYWDVYFDGTLGQDGRSNKFYNGANNLQTVVFKDDSVQLPAVGDWIRRDQFGNGDYVTAPNATGYSYKLNGWYMINAATGEKNYYKPGEYAKITHDTVFYADWVPDNYNKGPYAGAQTLDTPTTAGFVKTELFDYNELINTYGSSVNVSLNYARRHTDTWNSNREFDFISWNYNGNPSYSIGMPGNLQEGSQYRYDTLTKGIYGRNQDFIDNIFNSNIDLIGKTNVGTGDHLFNYNPVTGEYYYDSDKNAATYNQNDGRFYVYRNREYINDNDGTPMTNFLPFNDMPGNYYSSGPQNTGATNYWFGMKNTIDFYLPDDVAASAAAGGSGNKNPVSGDDMIFKFSGDDDVWVFVEELDDDGNPIPGTKRQVLDLGGIHNRAGGFINFSTGEVTTFKGTIENRQNIVSDPDSSAALKQLKSGNCRMTVLYLERGSSLSNCSIYFNLEPIPKTLELSKRLEGLTPSEHAKYANEEFTYELVINGTPYNSTEDERYWAVYYDKNGKKIMETKEGETEPVVKKRQIIDGQIAIKDGETVKIPRLDRFDTFYVAEEKGLNMNQFEIPHAERKYVDNAEHQHEEEVTLHQEHSNVADVDDWATPRYQLENTEKVTFTNTIRETELEVRKKWVEDDPKNEHPDIQFTVEATIEGEDGQPVRYKVDQLRDETNPEKNKVFTLSTEDGENEAIALISDLPVMTNNVKEGKVITYTVSEVKVDGYNTKYERKDHLWDIDVMKLWADGDHQQEEIKVRLQRDSDKKYYDHTENGAAVFTENGQEYTLTQDAYGDYMCRFHDLPRDDTYKIVQSADSNADTTGLAMYKRDIIDYEITNTEDDSKITVIKKWLNADGSEMETAPQDYIGYTVYQAYHEHKWGEWQDKPGEAATETTAGKEIRYCEYDHSHYQERDKGPIGHVHRWTTTVYAPTCTENGYTHYRCEGCGSEYDDDIVPATGHNYTSVITTPADCEHDGVITYTCHNINNGQECGDSYTRDIPATGHNWSEWTANADGKTESRTCSNCQTVQTRSISPYSETLPGNSDLPVCPDPTEVLPMPENPNDQNAKVDIRPTGIFKITENGVDHYYLIIGSRDNESWNQVWDASKQQYNMANLKNFGLAVEIDPNAEFYDAYSFTLGNNYQSYNGRRNDLKKGDLYHAVDGSWYVYIDNAADGMAPPNERWLKLADGSSEVTTTGGDAGGNNGANNGANSTSNANSLNSANKLNTRNASAKPSLLAAIKTQAAKLLGDGDSESGGNGTGGAETNDSEAGEGSGNAVVLPANLSSLQETYNKVDENGRMHDGKGNYLVEYGSYTLNKSEHTDWTMEIKVPKTEQGDEWTNYRYYVTETDPSTGYDTTYTYENLKGQDYEASADGIKEKGRVTIKNQVKPLDTDIHIIKVDEKGKELPGAVFTIQKKEGDTWESVKSIKNEDGKTLKYPDIGGIDDKSQFTSNGTMVDITKIPDGEYKLIENSAPGGYVITQNEIPFRITDGKLSGTNIEGKVTFDENTASITVVNIPGAELPHTGGPGTMYYKFIGLALIACALVFYGAMLLKRRRAVSINHNRHHYPGGGDGLL